MEGLILEVVVVVVVEVVVLVVILPFLPFDENPGVKDLVQVWERKVSK